MKRTFAFIPYLVLFVAVGCATYPARTETSLSVASSEGPVDMSFFYDGLAPYGEWFEDGSYGWCWTPSDVSSDWRPYWDGQWQYTDYGWSWASNEPWGWATYHYGRWFFDDSYGWVWVPGAEWGPAWVAWRAGDDWVGWAPLPPTADWNDSGGLGFSQEDAIPTDAWCFVPEQHLLDARLRVQVTMVARNVTLFERSRDTTRYEVRNGRPANLGLDLSLVETRLGRPVPRKTIVDVDAPRNGRGREVGHGAVGFFRPRIRPPAPGEAPPPSFTRNAVPDDVAMRRLEEQQRKLENDLNAERARLVRDQEKELRDQKGQSVDEIRRRQATEMQAFEVHAAKQRRALEERMHKRGANQAKGQREDQRGRRDEGGREPAR